MRSVPESIRHTLLQEADTITALADSLDMKAAEEIVQMLVELRGKVFVAGCGTSGAAAKKIAHTLSCIECAAAYLCPADAVHGAMGAVGPDDALILISKGGGTKEIVKMVPGGKARGARIIAITENENSELAQSADYVLKVKVAGEPDPWNMLATASTMAVIAAMDAIAIAVMERNGFTRAEFAVIHPGGAVGERLLSNQL